MLRKLSKDTTMVMGVVEERADLQVSTLSSLYHFQIANLKHPLLWGTCHPVHTVVGASSLRREALRAIKVHWVLWTYHTLLTPGVCPFCRHLAPLLSRDDSSWRDSIRVCCSWHRALYCSLIPWRASLQCSCSLIQTTACWVSSSQDGDKYSGYDELQRGAICHGRTYFILFFCILYGFIWWSIRVWVLISRYDKMVSHVLPPRA